MSIVLVFITGVAAMAGLWLSRQRLMSKPWLETGIGPGVDTPVIPVAKIGLGVFLVVVGGLFALFGSAFVMRMDFADWQNLSLPRIVWINLVVLILASVFLQVAVSAARRGDEPLLRAALVAGVIATFGFLIGQLMAWQVLVSTGNFLGSNPAASFFYLITGMHGLHVLGGVIGLGRVALRLRSGIDPARARIGVELCATYWHFLLIVWIAMIALLLGWANQFIALCIEQFT